MGTPAAVPDFFRILHFPSLGSTSDEAKRLALQGAEAGTLVWADRQTDGHGRFGRAWISPPGNLYASLLLRPARPAQEAMQLTFVAAVALAEGIAACLPSGRATTCKWPNDVLVGSRKVSGILLESSADSRGGVDSLVIGVGVNVASHPPAEQVQYVATSLHAEGAAAETPASVLERFCSGFLGWYERWRRRGFAPVREAWLARAEKLNRPVEVRLETGTVAGVFADLDATGALVLQQDGRRRLILAGDVFPSAA